MTPNRLATQKILHTITSCSTLTSQRGHSRASFEQGGGGGEGVLDPKLGVPKMA